MARKGEKKEAVSPDKIRDISEQIYRNRLNDPTGGGPGADARMVAKDGDNGEKLRGRTGSMTR